MVLSDEHIIQMVESGRLRIDPFDKACVEPASVDLHLGGDFKEVQWKKPLQEAPTLDEVSKVIEYTEFTDSVVLWPDSFVLATTEETVSLPTNISANVLGRSSLGRLGISIHQTAGYIDPGFTGEITLELTNHGPIPIEMQAGQRVCQIVFHELTSYADRSYGHADSQYQNQSGATPTGGNFDRKT